MKKKLLPIENSLILTKLIKHPTENKDFHKNKIKQPDPYYVFMITSIVTLNFN